MVVRASPAALRPADDLTRPGEEQIICGDDDIPASRE